MVYVDSPLGGLSIVQNLGVHMESGPGDKDAVRQSFEQYVQFLTIQ